MYPHTFFRSLAAMYKGPSRSSILGSFQAPHPSTLINAFELFFLCPIAFRYIYQKAYPLSTSGTPDHKAMCNMWVRVCKILNLPVRQVEPAQKK